MAQGLGTPAPGSAADAARRTQRLFVALALGFGFPLLLVSPPLTAPDEGRHLARVWTLAEGHWLVPAADRATVPRSLAWLEQEAERLWPARVKGSRPPAALAALLARPLAPRERIAVRNLSVYGPVAYLPQLAVVAGARPLELRPAFAVYAGRAAGLLAFTALVALAIHLAPRRRSLLLLLGLLPMTLHQAASFSADAMTVGLGFVLVAAALRAACDEGRLPGRERAALWGVAALFGLTKPGYWPVAAVLALVPARRFAGAADQARFLLVSALAALVPSLLWFGLASRADFAVQAVPGTDRSGQVAFVLAHPGAFLATLLATCAQNAGVWAQSFVGLLGRVDVPLPGLVHVLAGTALLTACLADGADPPALSPARRLALAALALAGFVLVLGFAYLTANPVGAPHVAGVQGRYFLPLAPLLAFAVPSRDAGPRGARPLGAHPGWAAALAAGLLAAALAALAQRYFGSD